VHGRSKTQNSAQLSFKMQNLTYQQKIKEASKMMKNMGNSS